MLEINENNVPTMIMLSDEKLEAGNSNKTTYLIG